MNMASPRASSVSGDGVITADVGIFSDGGLIGNVVGVNPTGIGCSACNNVVKTTEDDGVFIHVCVIMPDLLVSVEMAPPTTYPLLFVGGDEHFYVATSANTRPAMDNVELISTNGVHSTWHVVPANERTIRLGEIFNHLFDTTEDVYLIMTDTNFKNAIDSIVDKILKYKVVYLTDLSFNPYAILSALNNEFHKKFGKRGAR